MSSSSPWPRNKRRQRHGSRRKLTGTSRPREGLDLQALKQRKDRIERRIADLQAWRLPREAGTADERLTTSRQHALEAQAAARQAVISCRDAYLRAALAHDRAADTLNGPLAPDTASRPPTSR
jgi:hypothetical protein